MDRPHSAWAPADHRIEPSGVTPASSASCNMPGAVSAFQSPTEKSTMSSPDMMNQWPRKLDPIRVPALPGAAECHNIALLIRTRAIDHATECGLGRDVQSVEGDRSRHRTKETHPGWTTIRQ